MRSPKASPNRASTTLRTSGGLLGSCLLAFILPERFDPMHFAATVRRRALLGSITVLAATAGLAASAPQAAIDQMARLHSLTALAQAVDNFAKARRCQAGCR